MSVQAESERVCDAAIEAATNAELGCWNTTFKKTVEDLGHELLPVENGTFIGLDAPIVAPVPLRGESYQYAYPCLVAPKGWKLPDEKPQA